ncbi:MAG: hypothetical protein AAGI03_14315 [Pseudomonadota bacterium]
MSGGDQNDVSPAQVKSLPSVSTELFMEKLTAPYAGVTFQLRHDYREMEEYNGRVPEPVEHYSVGCWPSGEEHRNWSAHAAVGMWGLLVDDPKEPLPVKPTARLITSPGKEQWLYAFDRVLPIEDARVVARRLAQSGLGDEQGNNPVRLGRLPNRKPRNKDHAAQLVEFYPSRRFDPQHLAAQLGLPPAEVESWRTPDIEDTESEDHFWAERLGMEDRVEMVGSILAELNYPDIQGHRHEDSRYLVLFPVWRFLKGDVRGREMVAKWVERTFPTSKKPAENARRSWGSMKDIRGARRTIGTLIYEAAEQGWDKAPWIERSLSGGEVPEPQPAPTSSSPVEEEALELTPVARPPGVLGEIYDSARASAYRRNEQAALVGAIAAGSALVGNRVFTRRRGRLTATSGVQLLLAGGTASGKNAAIECVHRTLRAADLSERAFTPVSGPALIKGAHKEGGNGIIVVDEFSNTLESIARGGGTSGHKAEFLSIMMEMYSRATTRFEARVAIQSASNTPAVDLPCVTGVFVATSKAIFEALTSSDLTSGRLNRMLVVIGPSYCEPVHDAVQGDIPPELSARLGKWGPMGCCGDSASPSWLDQYRMEPAPWPTEAVADYARTQGILTVSAGAERVLQRFSGDVEAILQEGGREADLWGRAEENALRLAGLCAALDWVSEIRESDMLWAVETVRGCVSVLVAHARGNIADGPLDSGVRAALRAAEKYRDERGWAEWNKVAQAINRSRGVRVAMVRDELEKSEQAAFVKGEKLNSKYSCSQYLQGRTYLCVL